MPRFSIDQDGSPCPVRPSPTFQTSFPLVADDDTEDLDFTRALPADFQFPPTTRARRRGQGLREPPKRITGIFTSQSQRPSDEKEKEKPKENVKDLRSSEPNFYTDVALALQPQHQQTRGQPLCQQPRRIAAKRMMEANSNRRRISTMLAARARQQAETTTTSTASPKEVLEDKTHNSANLEPRPVTEKNLLLVRPKRIPLQLPVRPLPQQVVGKGSRRGNSGGKENVPPGEREAKVVAQKAVEAVGKPRIPLPSREPMKRRSEAMLVDEEDLSFVSSISSDRSSASSGRGSFDGPGHLRLKRRKMSARLLPTPPSLSQEEEAELASFSLPLGSLPPAVSFRHLQPRELNPVLKEDIARTEMYEDSWLLAQESSVSQLLNSILSPAFSERLSPRKAEVRSHFMNVYSSAPFPLLFKRLQASLLYGALAVPKDSVGKSSAAKLASGWGWAEDFAVRKKFLGLFKDTYEAVGLVPALEVVVGREMFVAPCKTAADQKKVLEGFLERYIMRCEDAIACPPHEDRGRGGVGANSHGDNEDWGSAIWLLRKSLLRGLMLVLLMDKAKTQGILGRNRLFKKSSTYKSSASVVHAISRLLLPSAGDILRPLGHLNYLPEVSQSPLEEYDYEIKNLAVDMRDGVRLSRVVELLLYPDSPMPTFDPATAGGSPQGKWPLTSNLKFPATSRTHKLHNVSVGLAALESVGGNPRGVVAKDVVDGFREKTVGLLWGIVSRWGLEMLVDWNEVRREIRRLRVRKATSGLPPETDYHGGEQTDHVRLLKDWASCIASARGIKVENLTTSFADGRVFQVIVEEYEQYFPATVKRDKQALLKEKLRALGCSSYFAGLFGGAQKADRVFDKDFVVAGLAYLCSRLFQWSMKERAAMTIQRAYRARMFRRGAHKRINLLILAHECANVVNTRDRVIKAAITIQTAFRKYLDVKIRKLINGITNIQSAMRGKLVRQRVEKSRAAVVVLQSRWRDIREEKFQRRIGIAKEAMMGFQAVARGLLLRNRLERLRSAVLLLEERRVRCLRGRAARTYYLCLKKATAMIQRWWEDRVAVRAPRKRFVRAIRSTVELQALLRGTLARRRHAELLSAAVLTQQRYKAWRAAKKARLEYLAIRGTTLNIQRGFRSCVVARRDRQRYIALRARAIHLQKHWIEKIQRRTSAILIQRAWRRFSWLVRLRKMLGEVITIQSLWRGYRVRQGSCARVRIARRRVGKVMATPVSEGDTLLGRLSKGLELMKTSAGYGRGVMQLDLATRYSRECAVMTADNELAMVALLSNIESAIKQMQKSVSSVVARNLILSINVLANLSKSSKAVQSLAKQQFPGPRTGKKQPTAAGAAVQDMFTILLDALEMLRASPANTPQSDLFLTISGVVGRLAGNAGIRTRLVSRKKWMERLDGLLEKIRADGGKRVVVAPRTGGSANKGDLAKITALGGVMAVILGSEN